MAQWPVEKHAVLITVFGKSARAGELRVRLWPAKERTLRVLKGLMGCWGLGILALFIPIAHFVLVPALFLGGIVIAFRWSGEKSTFIEACGPCPECGGLQKFKLRGKFLLPKEASCPSCGGRVIFRPSTETTEAGGEETLAGTSA